MNDALKIGLTVAGIAIFCAAPRQVLAQSEEASPAASAQRELPPDDPADVGLVSTTWRGTVTDADGNAKITRSCVPSTPATPPKSTKDGTTEPVIRCFGGGKAAKAQDVAANDDNPFAGPREPKAPPPPKNEGILAKLRRLGCRVETNPVDGTLAVSQWSGRLTEADVMSIARLGNLRSLVLAGCPISDRAAEQLAKNLRLSDVNLDRSSITDAGLKALARLPKLESLSLRNTKVGDEGVTSLRGHPSLRLLDLQSTRASNEGVKAISGNEKLRDLDLFGTRVTGAAMPDIAKLQHLQSLWLNGGVSDDGLGAIEALVELTELGGLGEVTDAGLHHLRNMTQLCLLRGGMSRVTDNGLRSIRALTSLSELRLDNSQVSDEGMKIIGRMHYMCVLSLGKTKITDAGIRELRDLTEIQSLDCRHTAIGDPALEVIGTFTKLQNLCIAGTRVTDAGMKSLTRLSVLNTLDLTQTRVDDRAMGSIAQLPRLGWLHVSSTQVGDRGLEKLVGMPALRDVYVDWPNVTEPGVKLLSRQGVSVTYIHSRPRNNRIKPFPPTKAEKSK
jgi:Leucine-rich repeat (LRR) protein